MQHGFYLVYPDRRWVSDQRIIDWYTDALASGLIQPCNEFVHDANDVVGMTTALANIGWITVGKA